ncbi:Major facilitator superfamily domain, general substrate transporter [Lasallia pustulata]|uniref:Major facilitator superfamily domain, general substrate transporter n=1 Tax=Lasallia pustulata TaxID=136370 RepID=A0A1W5D9P5_9LECA|nr:Major facilitator superfamily domain, general substrate transporter [Lasallia pustulata]
MATYFSTKRSLAISCAASGAATGGVVFPIIAQQLLPKIGFGWTVRVMGFVILANHAIVITLARARIPPRTTGSTIEWAAFKELPYVLFTIGMFLTLWGVYFTYYYVTPFGRDIIHVSPSTSITLLLILNGVGVPGRIVPALLADRYFGVLNLLIPTVFCAGVLLYCWTAVHSMGGQIVFVIIYGYFGAGVQGLFPATLSSLTTDMKKMGVRIGMVFSIISIACLTGPPLAGALIQKREGDYLYAQIFGGTVMVCGSLTLIAARIAQTGWNLKRRM